MIYLVFQRFLLVVFLVIFSQLSFAHHSFAPHFDASKSVTISGIVTEFEQRNPHAYLHILAEDANGQSHEYVCETHGVTQLGRNGIDSEMLAVGTQLSVTGSQHRRDPYMCFFQTIYLADGRVLDVNGPRRAQLQPQVAQRDSIYGTWLLMPANRSTSGPNVMMDYLTPAAELAVANYNPFTDDPTFRCEPVAPRRAWFAPGTPMSLRREGNTIYLRHEWMDVERVIQLDLETHPEEGEKTVMGHSIGHFEGDTLVIETANFAAGVLRQYIEQENGPTLGMLHSEAFTVVERISFDAATNRIKLSIQQDDPEYYSIDFSPASAEYAATELEIQPFGCIPEILK